LKTHPSEAEAAFHFKLSTAPFGALCLLRADYKAMHFPIIFAQDFAFSPTFYFSGLGKFKCILRREIGAVE